MIIKELYELYDRLFKEGVKLPPQGWSVQNVSFRIVLNRDGSLARIQDVRSVVQVPKGKKTVEKLVSSEVIVPGNTKPSGSGVNPCFLWDNMAYLLGNTDAKPRAMDYFAGFQAKHLSLETEIRSEAFSAVCRFLERWNPDRCADVFREHGLNIKDFEKTNGVFCLRGHDVDVHDEPEVKEWWDKQGFQIWGNSERSSVDQGMCLVTGEVAPIAKLHEPVIKGVLNAQVSGAKIVSYNCNAFESYGKEQGENAPVSERVAHKYACALNYLLGQQLQRTRIGDATVVFWTDAPREKAAKINLFTALAFDPTRTVQAQDPVLLANVQEDLRKVSAGKLPGTAEERKEWEGTRFFILGLSPNSSRLSIRFYYESSMAEWVNHLQSHYSAMKLQRRPGFKDPEIISPGRILLETEREAKDISPVASAALMRSILGGLPYPDSVAMRILSRFHADGQINFVRCSYLKAWLNRKKTSFNLQPMLDENNTQPGYVLGRLFAVLVKAQKDVLPNLNRTIQDSYYGSASASPRSVFPRILRLHRHHLGAMETSVRIAYDKLEQEICGKLHDFPAHLNLEQQGLFALGFYHQTQTFYTKKNNNQPDNVIGNESIDCLPLFAENNNN